jgi:hypothetical protein
MVVWKLKLKTNKVTQRNEQTFKFSTKNNRLFSQIKDEVIKGLSSLSFEKKDRSFLLSLIELFDLLTDDKEEKFINKLSNLINKCDPLKREEVAVRLKSLKIQLEKEKYIEKKQLPYCSFYVQKGRVDIYIKKLLFD